MYFGEFYFKNNGVKMNLRKSLIVISYSQNYSKIVSFENVGQNQNFGHFQFFFRAKKFYRFEIKVQETSNINNTFLLLLFLNLYDIFKRIEKHVM